MKGPAFCQAGSVKNKIFYVLSNSSLYELCRLLLVLYDCIMLHMPHGIPSVSYGQFAFSKYHKHSLSLRAESKVISLHLKCRFVSSFILLF